MEFSFYEAEASAGGVGSPPVVRLRGTDYPKIAKKTLPIREVKEVREVRDDRAACPLVQLYQDKEFRLRRS